jgi:hypothetical protein
MAILCSHRWDAGLSDYDYVQEIRFRRNGRGSMGWGGGQAMKFEAEFRYSVPVGNRLDFEFFDEDQPLASGDLAYKRSGVWARWSAVFDLVPGPHETAFGTMAGLTKRSFPYLLRFDREPFPPGCEPGYGIRELDYYGSHLIPGEEA